MSLLGGTVEKLVLAFIAASFAALASSAARAHEVPDETTVFAFVKPEGDTLTLLVRAPMNAIRDIDGIVTRADGTVDLSQVEQPLRDGAQVWIRDFIKLYENGRQLPVPEFLNARVSLLSDRSFSDFDEAHTHITTTDLDPATMMRWEQGYLDVAYAYPIESDASNFAIEPGLTRLGVQVNVTMRYVAPAGYERQYDVHAYVGRVTLDPGPVEAAGYFAKGGFFEVLRSVEAILFLVALVMPFRRSGPVGMLLAAFALGGSISLFATASGYSPNTLWFPYLVSFLVGFGILYLAVENILAVRSERRLGPALCFGLVFGFAFAFILGERMQFAGGQRVLATIAFDVGLLLGSLITVAVAFSGLALIFRHIAPERIGTIVLSAFIAHTAWDWTLERGAALSRFQIPTFTELMLSGALWWVTAALALGAVAWILPGIAPRRPGAGGASPAPGT